MLCSRGGDPMMAKIGFMKALHRGREREFNTDRKETHWGKRKLKRDECKRPPTRAAARRRPLNRYWFVSLT